jgi:Rrf2 family protein
MKISTKSQYGLRAMVYLAKCKNRICSLKEVSEKEDISFDYLEKIISKLEKNGFLISKKGAQGGYFLARKSSKIKIGEIVGVLEGEKPLVKCLAKKCYCSKIKKCRTISVWKKLEHAINTALNSITLADLIKN